MVVGRTLEFKGSDRISRLLRRLPGHSERLALHGRGRITEVRLVSTGVSLRAADLPVQLVVLRHSLLEGTDSLGLVGPVLVCILAQTGCVPKRHQFVPGPGVDSLDRVVVDDAARCLQQHVAAT